MAQVNDRKWVCAGAVGAVLLGVAVAAGAPPAAVPAADEREGATAPPVGERSLDAILEPIRAKHGLPALAGAIVRGGEVVAIGAVGVRRAGGEEKVTVDDLWHIGSCTKSMTATLCAVLVEQGTMRWDMTIAEVFPELAGTMHEGYRGVTLEQLLTNRGGVPTSLDAGGLWGQLFMFGGSPTEARRLLLRSVTSRAPSPEPGTFMYSNGGFSIAGHMAEEVMGKSYEELMQELVFAPLGITTAGFGAPRGEGGGGEADQPWGHRVGRAGRGGAGVPPDSRGSDNPAAISPAGRVHLSMQDWARYVAAHLRGDPENPHAAAVLVKGETYGKMHTPAAGEGVEYAMGWGRLARPWGGGEVLTHNGSNTMWFAVTWIAPKKDFAVLVACNRGGDAAEEACDEVAGALIGEVGKGE
jgi:CubicO group peptidase (beta-lactamase class C family)